MFWRLPVGGPEAEKVQDDKTCVHEEFHGKNQEFQESKKKHDIKTTHLPTPLIYFIKLAVTEVLHYGCLS